MKFAKFLAAFNTPDNKAALIDLISSSMGDHLVEVDGRWEPGTTDQTDDEEMSVEIALYAAAEAAYDAFMVKLGVPPAAIKPVA